MKKHLVITGTSPPPIFFPVKAGLRKQLRNPLVLRWGVEPHFPRHGVRGISSYAIVGTVATVVFSVTYASSPILSPVGFPRLLT